MANTTADKLAKLEATKSALKSAINGSGSTVGDKFADYPTAVTDGKAGIAAAITEKGVPTSADAPFDVLEANIKAIKNGVEIITGTFSGLSNATNAYLIDETGKFIEAKSLSGKVNVMKNGVIIIVAQGKYDPISISGPITLISQYYTIDNTFIDIYNPYGDNFSLTI